MFKLKRSIKVTNLSDFIIQNNIILYYILYHIFVFNFNNNNFNYLQYLIDIFPDGSYQFTYIQNNLSACQLITVISLLLCILLPIINPFVNKSFTQKEINNYRFIVVVLFYTIKNIYSIIDLYYYDRDWLSNTENNYISDALDFKYRFYIELPYLMGLSIIIPSIIGIFIYLFGIIILEYIIPNILYIINLLDEYAKKITCTYIEYKIETKLEEV